MKAIQHVWISTRLMLLLFLLAMVLSLGMGSEHPLQIEGPIQLTVCYERLMSLSSSLAPCVLGKPNADARVYVDQNLDHVREQLSTTDSRGKAKFPIASPMPTKYLEVDVYCAASIRRMWFFPTFPGWKIYISIQCL